MKTAPDIVFYQPCIPGNTGNAIRLAAVTGTKLHLIKPLGFDMDDKKVRRAGLDYHDLAHVIIHDDFNAFLEYADANYEKLLEKDIEKKADSDDFRIFAFTTHTDNLIGNMKFNRNDYLLFGPEPSGLPEEILSHPKVCQTVRIPMVKGVRSLNLAVSASIAVYEAWRQNGYSGAI